MHLITEKELSEEQKNKLREIEMEFDRKVSEIPEPELHPGRLDNGSCEPYDSIWKWLREEIIKVLE